jgi:large subunit ribosomal protein L9
MEVILLERVGKLGTVGDVVKVKNGFGRNYLLPQKKAMRATKESKAFFDAQRAEIEAKNAEARANAEAQATAFEGLSVTLIRQAGEDGKLYGSITVRDVLEELQAKGHRFDRKQIEMSAPVKQLGDYTLKLILHPEVVLDLPVQVTRNAAAHHAAE